MRTSKKNNMEYKKREDGTVGVPSFLYFGYSILTFKEKGRDYSRPFLKYVL